MLARRRALALSGFDSSIAGDTVTQRRMERRPSGLKLVDTRTGRCAPSTPAASVSWQAGRLVSTGRTWNSEAQVERGTGMTLFGPGDRPPRHLLGTRMVWDAYLNGDLVYADLDTGAERSLHVVVSLGSGRVLASSDAPLPLLLLDERDRPC